VQEFGTFESLLSADAVRERSCRIGELALGGQAQWFTINETNFERCVSLVQRTCEKNYPDLVIPYHSRWRHFEIGDECLWDHYTRSFSGDKIDLARTAVDLVFLSVLLDAGAGGDWAFEDPVTNVVLKRSEGLAAASVELFFNHVARLDPQRGWLMDAACLNQVTESKLALAFQHSNENPLLGVGGRLSLLHGLGKVLQDCNNTNASYSRPGNIIDECFAISRKSYRNKSSIDAARVLEIVLKRFGLMWPSGYICNGLNLGDCGYHSLLTTDDETNGIIPFHKLSQWLTYSLIEPLQWAGIKVTNLDGLTGLPEYRNGGLFIDTGALQPLDPGLMQSPLTLQSEAVVEWRALTVFMLDRLADELRGRMKLSVKQLPLCAILQGGTWATGRELAARLRPGAPPPLNLVIDGTIF
jgi:hypothetical protein